MYFEIYRTKMNIESVDSDPKRVFSRELLGLFHPKNNTFTAIFGVLLGELESERFNESKVRYKRLEIFISEQ